MKRAFINLFEKNVAVLKIIKLNQEQRAPLVDIVIRELVELISIDYLYLDNSKRGYEYLVIVADNFTKYVQAFSNKRKSGWGATDLLFNTYCLNQGFLKHAIHCQSREFEYKLFKLIEQLVGIKSFERTGYSFMGNRISERINRTAINMLKTLTGNHKLNWKDHIR